MRTMLCITCGLEIGRSISVGQVEAVIRQLPRPNEDEGDPRLHRLCASCRAVHFTLREQQLLKQQSNVSRALLDLNDADLGVRIRDFFVSALDAVPADALGHFARAVLTGDSITMAEATRRFASPPEFVVRLFSGHSGSRTASHNSCQPPVDSEK